MVHGSHRPEALTTVFHHIVPREWQAKWSPRVPAHELKIWAPDCIQVCPTGHANIHYWITEMGKQLHLQRYQDGEDVGYDNAWGYINDCFKPPGANRRELLVAKQAFLNWAATGGSWDVIVPRGRS